MGLAQSVQLALARMLSAGRVEVREDGAWLAVLEGFSYEVREQGEAALLHLWSQQSNQVRRVTRIVREDSERLALEVARLGRGRAARLEFFAAKRKPSRGRVTRGQFRIRFQRMLTQQFPDETGGLADHRIRSGTFSFRQLRARDSAQSFRGLGGDGCGACGESLHL